MRILIVEDERKMASILKKGLEAENHCVSLAFDGRSGLELALSGEFRHKGLKRFAETGSKTGIQPKHADRLRRLLTALDVASVPQDVNAPGCMHCREILPITGR